jgi:aminopeptidase N
MTLDFAVGIPRDPTTGYAMFGQADGVTALPDFYPVIPARDESGWHIEVAPSYGDETFNPTALYDVSITAPPAQTVVTSGTCREPEAGAWHCVSGPMRDFMLAMSADYKVALQTVDGVTVRSFYLPADETGGKRALQVASDALKVYSRRFGPYPFAELDVIETATRASGIEYPGLVVIADRLYQQADEGSYFDFVVAHEVAHQWWYSLVGDDQVNHPWLDESFVGYSVILYYEDTFGKSIANRVLKDVFEDSYQKLVQEKRDQKVDQPVAAFTEQDYGAVVYLKGPLFFKALREAMGDAKFDAFLKTYFNQNRYGIATPERLLAAAESVADKATVRSIYSKWIESATTP